MPAPSKIQIPLDIFGHEIRAIASAEARATLDQNNQIIGYAAVFNVLSRDLGGFREQIRPGAFARCLAAGADVRALWQHDPALVLGRTAAGTLDLAEDDRGLRYTITPPDTQWARDAVVTIGRGDVNQSSFAFKAIVDEWSINRETDEVIRTLVDVDLFDVSPVTYPAYLQTNSVVRSSEAGVLLIDLSLKINRPDLAHKRRRVEIEEKLYKGV